LEIAFVILSMLIFSRALVFSLLGAGHIDVTADLDSAGDEPAVISEPKLFWLYLPLYIGTGLLLLPRLRLVIRTLRAERYVALLLVLAVLSSVWSTDPRETLVKSGALIACTLFGVYLAIRYTILQQLQLFAAAFAAIIIASCFVALYVPRIGIMHGIHEGIWCGVFLHKNALGGYMLLAGIVYFLLTTDVAKIRVVYHAAFWLAFTLLTMSCAKASLLSWIILFTIVGAYCARIGRPRMAAIALVSVVLAASSFIVQYKYKVLPPILLSQVASNVATAGVDPASAWAQLVADFEAAQRNAPASAYLATGNGRLRLWGHLWEMIQQRPWLGYGFGGFWRGMQGPSAQIWLLEPWRPPGAHNSFIDVSLDLGFVGLGLLALSIGAALVGGVASVAKGTLQLGALFPMAMLIALCLAKVGESGLFGANILTWIIFVTAVLNAQKDRAGRARHAPSATPSEPAGGPV
jgi:exopolysaccharide production protein ExoQ